MEHVIPIVNIAKENMITNCNKNNQYMHAKSDIEEVWVKISKQDQIINGLLSYEQKFSEYDHKLKEMKSSLFRDTTNFKKISEDLRAKFLESIANNSDRDHLETIKERRIKNIEEAFIAQS